ncbi:glycoside hydrolase/phage tail family protein [Brevundimonas sp.]|uniref:glycoside hydrolase/phage tail family protein n=1 Tax=Brevundimonas sp. TaxID=1871086 RepID=UPI00289E36C8|nr:glycoside hydrolase/phage tail family protein [Brevundimonas sp.]
MASTTLTMVGGFLGGPIGAALGGMVGGMIDNQIVASLQPARQIGPRLESLKIQGSAEGAPMSCVFGRARVTGQVIWAARFLESKHKSSGGKGGQKTVDYRYSLSFAVALCEGEIDGVGRVWADGMPMDLNGVTWRVYRGSEDQTPDPLIEAIEVEAPAYRGTAYVVFEDLALEAYGDRVPQLSFEVFRRARGDAPRLEDRLDGVCLIPGAGEFCLADEVVLRRESFVRSVPENAGSGQGRADLEVSLDQLTAQLPNVKRVNLVVGWFGTDVQAAQCRIKPGVERRDKPTDPLEWGVAGLDRSDAHLISRVDGAVAYGGTPSDQTVRQAIRALKRRGLEVVIYPFVFMDCEGYPWRGRVAGRHGADAAADVAAVFGAADGWGLRRQALHYARIAREEGAHGLIIGSEMRGLTLTRDAAGGFAADWSEYAGLRDAGEVRFHLDPLWADPNIDFVGIDWYPPMGDWRAGDGGVDAEAFEGPWDVAYLAGQVAGGRDYDWYYASAADEAAQVRTPILDGAYGEDWVWRVKDLKGWWSNRHYERVAGVRQAQPTAWVPGMKPVRLTEFGCAAVDRGGNAPNLFVDPKSSENALPPHSTGARDDRMQRALLEAMLGHFDDPVNNPVSAVYGRRMLEGADAWCWDARPYPAFPARDDLWADAGAWRTGHWLNGRMQGQVADIVSALLKRAGLAEGDYRIEGLEGTVAGLVIDRPMTTRAALGSVLTALGAVASEKSGTIVVSGAVAAETELALGALALPEDGGAVVCQRALQDRPQGVRVRFISEEQTYQTGAVIVRSDRIEPRGEGAAPLGDVLDVDLPMVVSSGLARTAARRVLGAVESETVSVRLGPLEGLLLEAGDVVTLEGRDGRWRVGRVAYEETVQAELMPVVEVPLEDAEEDWKGGGGGLEVVGAPWMRVLDLPALPGEEVDARPVVAVAADPWWPMTVHGGADAGALTARADVDEPTTVGELVAPLAAGPVDRCDRVNRIRLRLGGGSLQSLGVGAVLDGANALAVESGAGWEIVQFCEARLVAGDVWELSQLLRGRLGTVAEAERGAVAGAGVVVLSRAMPRLEVDEGERGLLRLWRAGPKGLAPAGSRFSERQGVWTARARMPWRPVHLKLELVDDGLRLSWVPCVARGDSWEAEAVDAEALRFRVRVMQGEVVVREWEVAGTQALYADALQAADFPQGWPVGAALAVAQWGAGWGWGDEARLIV